MSSSMEDKTYTNSLRSSADSCCSSALRSDPQQLYTKLTPLHDAISFVCNGSSMMSKRLSAPMTVCNGEIHTKSGTFLFRGDINIKDSARGLYRVAEYYGETLHLRYEFSKEVLWSSEYPRNYLGFCKVDNVTHHGGQLDVYLYEAYPYFEKLAKQQQRQWMLEHNLARRNPIEWLSDARYSVKWGLYYFFKRLRRHL